MRKKLEIAGQRFGRLTALEESGKKGSLIVWKCRCDCGKEIAVIGSSLTTGHTKSCGCYKSTAISKAKTIHGETNTRLYHIWAGIKARCNNPHKACFSYYGGRGIKYCSEWEEFEPFKRWAMQNGYSDKLTIDRINSNGDYSPENCRWVDRKIQSLNRRSAHLITYRGETKSLIEWSRLYCIDRNTIKSRLKRGWSIEDALTHKLKKSRYG